MAQIKQSVSVTNGSQIVTVTGDYSTRVRRNHVFMLEDTLVPYIVAQDGVFDFSGNLTTITLTGAYQGYTNAAVAGVFAVDATYPDLIPTISQGDVGTAAIFTSAMYKLQAMILTASPVGLQVYADIAAQVLTDRQTVVTAASVVADLAAQAQASNVSATQQAVLIAASAMSALEQATIATTQATASAGSATAAASSSTTATNSATTAATAAASLVSALASFRAVFLGDHSTDPLLDGNGNAIADGAEYFNTTNHVLRVRVLGVWQDHDADTLIATQNAITAAANAAGSAAAALASQIAAAASATAAAASESTTVSLATAAADSATASVTSSDAATAKASDAATSATGAAGSATTATSAAIAATAQASNAAASEVSAAGSAIVALTQADIATVQAGNAVVSAGESAAFATASATQAAAALASKNASQDNLTAAQACVAAALESETNALASETAAAGSTIAAAASQLDAAASKSAAAASAAATATGVAAAADSATSAANSATSAANSAASASGSATVSMTKATEAASSANNAVGSAAAGALSATAAASSATSASISAGAAGASASGAATSQSIANSASITSISSKDAAADSAAAAAIDAGLATSKASAAANSATSAANSALTASDSATTATSAATASAASAAITAGVVTAAQNSATAAATAETNAAISKNAAEVAAIAAAAAEADVVASATAAASSATAAASSATTATTQATTATTQAANSAISAATAATRSAEAENSANSAASSAASSANSAASIGGIINTAAASAQSASAAEVAAASSASASAAQATSSALSATAASSYSSGATAQASIASVQAANAANSANLAAAASTNAIAAESTATTQASIASTQAGIASTQANASSLKSIESSASASAALASQLKAAQWADATPNVQVEAGQYSARHWAAQAQASVVGALTYRGMWDASSGTHPDYPHLGDYYRVGAPGNVGMVFYSTGDSIVYNGATWDKNNNTNEVNSVNGETGSVILNKAHIGLSLVDNTSDLSKPVSTATQSALSARPLLTELALVASSGSYNDLSNQPAAYSLPTATSIIKGGIKSSTSILVDISTGIATATPDSIGALSVSYAPAWAEITGKPVTLSEYGITEAVTQVTASAPLSATSGKTPIISMTQATAAFDGYLSASDWATFSGKQAALGFTAIDAAAIGAASGVAPLGADSKIAATYLPSYVDDVLEFADQAGLPITGESGKIYTTIDTGRIYRWGGSTYVNVAASPGSTDAVPEGSANLYFDVSRVLGSVLTGISFVTNAAISASDTVLAAFGKLQKQITDALAALAAHIGNNANPHDVTKSQVGLGSADDTADTDKPVSTAQQTAINTMGSEKQPLDATLTALAGVTVAADKLIYATGADAFGTTDLTAAGRALLDDADASAQRATLELGTLATQSGTFSGISSGTNTGDQLNISGNAATVTTNADLTGDVASNGNATAIAANAVTNAKIAQMASKTYKGRTSADAGNAEDVPVATLKVDLTLVKGDVGLANADNTSDLNKPVSTAMQAALDTKLDDASLAVQIAAVIAPGNRKEALYQLLDLADIYYTMKFTGA